MASLEILAKVQDAFCRIDRSDENDKYHLFLGPSYMACRHTCAYVNKETGEVSALHTTEQFARSKFLSLLNEGSLGVYL